jgi:hypothetical protein
MGSNPTCHQARDLLHENVASLDIFFSIFFCLDLRISRNAAAPKIGQFVATPA